MLHPGGVAELGEERPVVEGRVERVGIERAEVGQAERRQELGHRPKEAPLAAVSGRGDGEAEEGGVAQPLRCKAGDRPQVPLAERAVVAVQVVQEAEWHGVQRRVDQRQHGVERHRLPDVGPLPLAAGFGLPRQQLPRDPLRAETAEGVDRAVGDRLAGPVQLLDGEAHQPPLHRPGLAGGLERGGEAAVEHEPGPVSRLVLDQAAQEVGLEFGLEAGADPARIELHHHEVDGRGPSFMDWPSSTPYCRALATAFGLPSYFSWREGGFLQEMLRQHAATAPIVFETPQGLDARGGDGPRNTRLRFPQVSADLSVR